MARTNFKGGHYRAILEALDEGPLLTPELAATVGLSGSGTYHRCHRLEREKGWVRSKLTAHPQPYCIDCRQILTAANYGEHKDEDHEIRQSRTKVRLWTLTPAGAQALR